MLVGVGPARIWPCAGGGETWIRVVRQFAVVRVLDQARPGMEKVKACVTVECHATVLVYGGCMEGEGLLVVGGEMATTASVGCARAARAYKGGVLR